MSAPISLLHFALCEESHEVNTKVVPDSSERWTTEIAVLGRVTPGFSAAIAGSFHVVIFPLKMSAAVAPSILRPLLRPETW